MKHLKKNSTIILIVLLSLLGGCSAPPVPDITGVYVHHSGTKKYYTLTVKKSSSSKVIAQFEGVPLDMMKRFPWSIQCDGQIRGQNLKCAENKITIEKSPLRLTVTYKDGSNQVFINSHEGQKEEVILFQ